MRSLRIFFLTCITFLFLSGTSAAHKQVVVVPLGDDSKPLGQVVTVAKSNGDFIDPISAMASITDSSSNNPYLIVIAPGIYNLDESLIMKSGVSISGSGIGVTEIRASVSGADETQGAAVVMGFNSTLQNLTITNDAPGTHVTGVATGFGNRIFLNNLRVVVRGGNTSIAVRSRGSANHVTMTDIYARAEGSSNNIAVDIGNSPLSLHMTNIIAEALDGTGLQYGIFVENASPTMTNIKAVAGSLIVPAFSYGLYLIDSSASINNARVFTSRGTIDYCGIRNVSSSPSIKGLTLRNWGVAEDCGIRIAGMKGTTRGTMVKDSNISGHIDLGSVSLARVINTTLDRNILNNPSGTQCRNVYSVDTLASISC